MNDDLKKKLIYRSNHRGSQENDLLLIDFINAHVKRFSEQELETLAAFLDENDPIMFEWLTEKVKAPIKYQTLVQKIITFNKEKIHILKQEHGAIRDR